MQNATIEISNKSLNIQISPMGVKFSESLSIEEWENFGEQIGRVVNASQFIIGDWLNFGRNRWEKKDEFAERIKIATEKTGLDSHTLKCYASLARRVPFENRNTSCSFEQHKIVSKLDSEDQQKWLKVADERNMTTRVLKASIKAGKPITKVEYRNSLPKSSHNYDNCIVFVHNIERWYTRKKNMGYFDKLPIEQLVFERDKLKKIAEIYNEFNAMIREKQKEEK